MYKLNENFLVFDGFDLKTPKLFLFNVVTHITYVLEGQTRKYFFDIQKNRERGKNIYAEFEKYGFFEEI